MNFLRFLYSKVFLKHILILLGICLVGFFLMLSVLKLYVNHGKNITVPDFSGMMYNEVEEYAKIRDLEAVIIDSVYDNTKIKGSVYSQDPLPNSFVKKNRKIYLAIISLSSEMIRMPDLSDLTFRQAATTLENYGLKLGQLNYLPHIAKDAVLKQEFKGKEIKPGTLIEKGSKINLTLGQGIHGEKTQVPFLLGKTKEEAIKILLNASLNVGAEFFTGGATEEKAYVSQQKPEYSPNIFVNMGTTVDLWYKPKVDNDIQILQELLLQGQEKAGENK